MLCDLDFSVVPNCTFAKKIRFYTLCAVSAVYQPRKWWKAIKHSLWLIISFSIVDYCFILGNILFFTSWAQIGRIKQIRLGFLTLHHCWLATVCICAHGHWWLCKMCLLSKYWHDLQNQWLILKSLPKTHFYRLVFMWHWLFKYWFSYLYLYLLLLWPLFTCFFYMVMYPSGYCSSCFIALPQIVSRLCLASVPGSLLLYWHTAVNRLTESVFVAVNALS